MDNVLTLAAPEAGGLDTNDASQVREALAEAGAEVGDIDWLVPERAADIPFSGLTPEAAEETVAAAHADAPIDLLAQPQKRRRKRILVADMDSTIVRGETLDELAEHAEIGAEIAAITARAMRGEVAFRDAFAERIAMLEGLDTRFMTDVAEALELMPGAEELVATMKAAGARTALVSGGLQFFTEFVAERLGFDFNRGNVVEIADGKLTGRIGGQLVYRAIKRDILIDFASWNAAPLSATLAVGDGANDIDMIEKAGLGAAYHAKPILREHARARIDHGDLTTLLYFQGFREGEIVETG